MPHKAAVCEYCKAPLEVGRVHPSMTVYHGTCRLAHLRERWTAATCDLERDIITAEATAIKTHMKDLSHGERRD